MVSSLVDFISSNSKLTVSQRNIPLAYITRIFAMFMLIMPVRIIWMQQLLTNAQISVLTGIIFISTVFLELPTGAFADLVGKKITVQLSYFVYAIALFIYLWADSFWQFGVAVTLQGLAESLKSGAHAALVFDSLVEDGRQDEFKKINSQIMTVVQFSMVAATFLGGFLGKINLQLPFIVNAVLLIIAAFLVSLMKEPKVDTEKFTLKNYLRQTIDGTKHIFRNSKIAKLSILYMLVGGVSWTFQRLLRDMILIDVGYEQFSIGIIGGIFRLVNILFLAKLANSVRANKKGWDILFLPILMVLAYNSGFLLNHLTSLPIVAGIMMIGTGRFLLFNPYLQQEIESRYRATAMSAANLLVSILLSINMFGLGLFLDQIKISSVMVGYGLFSLIFIVPLAFLVRRDFIK